eukprot:XP_024999427.1 suppressor of tumorigenicity 7 protein-like isoform X3 [Gallus gallus]
MGAPGRAEPAGPRGWSRSGSSGLRSGDERGERGYLAGESPLLSPELRGETPPGSACPPRPFPVSPALAMADGCGTGKEPPYPGAAAALRRWEQLRRRAAAPWARGLLAVAAGLGLFYAALRVPLRLRDGLAAVTVFLSTLTPKFYFALTVTSSFISGLIFVFEWWHFRKYGTSFIEQVSVSHLRPLIGGVENSPPAPAAFSAGENEANRQNMPECKMWRNPLNLFRGAEYSRYMWVTGKEPLTYYDMNLSAQDHQNFFTCDTDALRPSDTGRDTNVLVYVKRRLAMCARKLGRIRESVKMMRDLMKEFPLLSMLNIHENLLEALLELQAYADVQAVLAKYDDISLPKSAAICYTAALLKARAVSERFSPETAFKRGLSTAEINAVEAIHRAVEFNPHVPKYLLEMKSLVLPPEHILKRGDSEAVAYAFFHLQHWKRIEGALHLLHCTWEGTFRMIPYPLEKGHLFYPYPSCTETADRELLPTFHEVSVYPQKELPFFIHFTAGLCSFSAMLALLTHQFPELMVVFAKAVLRVLWPVSAPSVLASG